MLNAGIIIKDQVGDTVLVIEVLTASEKDIQKQINKLKEIFFLCDVELEEN